MKRKRGGSFEEGITIDLDYEEGRRSSSSKRKREKKKEVDVEALKESVKPKDKYAIEKKKKSPKTAGELVVAGKTRRIERKLDRLDVKSRKVIEKMDMDIAELQDNSDLALSVHESEFNAEYARIFQTTKKILRRLEGTMLDEERNVSSKDIYALCTMYSSLRETIADMRSLKDINGQVEILATTVINPLAKSIGQHVIDMFHKVLRETRQQVSDNTSYAVFESVLKIAVSEMSSHMNTEFTSTPERLRSVMSGVN